MKLSIPKLTEKNYTIWAMMIETAAHSMMGYEFLTTKFAAPTVPNAKSTKEDQELYKNFYALQTLLFSSISENCLYIIRTNSTTPNDIWITLREHFNPSTNRNVIRLRGNFYRSNLQAYGTMARYIDGINSQSATINRILDEMATKMNSSGSSKGAHPAFITDMEKLTVLLYGLDDAYETTREILETDESMTYEKACIRLKEKADHPNASGSSSASASLSSINDTYHIDQANASEASNSRWKSRRCTYCGGLHRSEKCWKQFPHLKPDFGPKMGTSQNGLLRHVILAFGACFLTYSTTGSSSDIRTFLRMTCRAQW